MIIIRIIIKRIIIRIIVMIIIRIIITIIIHYEHQTRKEEADTVTICVVESGSTHTKLKAS